MLRPLLLWALLGATKLAAAAPHPAGAPTNRSKAEWGPPDLQEFCRTTDDVCHRFGTVRAPVDHQDAGAGEWDLVYVVNSDFWDPVEKPGGPIFINMW